MVNPNNQTVCDITGIILNDGVTVLPGYIAVVNGQVYRITANQDPNNHLTDPGILRNRREFAVQEDLGAAPEGVTDGHYADIDIMHKSVEIKERGLETEVAQAVAESFNPPIVDPEITSQLPQDDVIEALPVEPVQLDNDNPQPQEPEAVEETEPEDNGESGVEENPEVTVEKPVEAAVDQPECHIIFNGQAFRLPGCIHNDSEIMAGLDNSADPSIS